MALRRLFTSLVLLSWPIWGLTSALSAEGHPTIDEKAGWKKLFSGVDLTGWEMARPGSWVVEKGTLARKGRADLWTNEEYADFILDLEFKLSEGANSGVCLRVQRDPNVQPWWRDGALEVQVVDGKSENDPTTHDCGALYDLVAPSAHALRPLGEWNRLTVTAKGSQITVVMNGQEIVDADLDNWTEAQKNPDGSANKYAKPIKDTPRKGRIFLQEHGSPLWYRNISIKVLEARPEKP